MILWLSNKNLGPLKKRYCYQVKIWGNTTKYMNLSDYTFRSSEVHQTRYLRRETDASGWVLAGNGRGGHKTRTRKI